MFWEKTATTSPEYAENSIDDIREALLALDRDLRVVSASRSFYEVFHLTSEKTVGQSIYDLGNKEWDIPGIRELLETILPHKETVNNFKVEYEFAAVGRRIMLLNARQIQKVFEHEYIILLAIKVINERRNMEEARSAFAAIAESADDTLLRATPDDNTLAWNRGGRARIWV